MKRSKLNFLTLIICTFLIGFMSCDKDVDPSVNKKYSNYINTEGIEEYGEMVFYSNGSFVVHMETFGGVDLDPVINSVDYITLNTSGRYEETDSSYILFYEHVKAYGASIISNPACYTIIAKTEEDVQESIEIGMSELLTWNGLDNEIDICIED
ncbi:hypothetical protein [Flammeovirga sp. EKP202]|uniref:hypothetical protein n=1 Tax=Flammeovirga sp. EKP202 TaxID=2770592 RepID=UPI00165ED3D8|nr:hypothetical protein [Flammeovirga sp. EKP202]MBD0403612.1 hypothetical protein [Flammeovirga sp. EKP202]